MDIATWSEIQRLKKLERLSERQIARQLLISRGTVSRALKQLPGEKKGPITRGAKLDLVKAIITNILEEYPTLSAVRIFERIKQHGYQGELTTVRNYLRTIRGKKRIAFVRYETAPGEEAQVDWGYYGTLPFENCNRKIYFFVMVISYSRKLYVEFTTSQSLDLFLECHVNAFKYFEGIPRKILYDNLKSVVISRYVNHIQYNRKFLEFSGHYLFSPMACGVRKPHEKGKVENGVKYVKRNFLAGREFKNLADLESQNLAWLEYTANKRIHGTTKQIPDERFKKEKEYLIPLRAKDYNTTVPVQCKVYKDCFFIFDANYYSVPSKYVYFRVTVRANKYKVQIYYQERLIATHSRSYGKNQRIEDPKHFKDLLKIKKAAADSKLRDQFLKLSSVCEEYFQGLLDLERNIKKEIKGIMDLIDLYGEYEVIPAIEQALNFQAFGAIYVKNIVAQNRAKRHEKGITPLNLEKHPDVKDIEVIARNLGDYDNLFEDDCDK